MDGPRGTLPCCALIAQNEGYSNSGTRYCGCILSLRPQVRNCADYPVCPIVYLVSVSKIGSEYKLSGSVSESLSGSKSISENRFLSKIDPDSETDAQSPGCRSFSCAWVRPRRTRDCRETQIGRRRGPKGRQDTSPGREPGVSGI